MLGRLEKLQQYLAAGRFREAVKLLSVADDAFRRADPALPQRLAAVVAAALVHKGATGALAALAAVAEPAAIDPRWNRTLALAWEQRSGEEDDGPEPTRSGVGGSYLEDLAGAGVPFGERRPAGPGVGLVAAGGNVDCGVRSAVLRAADLRHDPERGNCRVGRSSASGAVCRSAPQLLATHQALGPGVPRVGPAVEGGRRYCKRLLERFPEHLETLLSLAEHHLGRDEPLAAREFAFRARQLKPLDADIKELGVGRPPGLCPALRPGGPVGRGPRRSLPPPRRRTAASRTSCWSSGRRSRRRRAISAWLTGSSTKRGTRWARRPRSGC